VPIGIDRDAASSSPIDSVTDTFPIVPGQLPDVGTKLLDPKASYVGTYRQLWDKLADPNFDVRGWQAMYRWVNDSVPFAGAAFRQWIVEFYQENRLARDMLEMDGRPVRSCVLAISGGPVGGRGKRAWCGGSSSTAAT